ncbi:hypothetical protein ACFL1X_14540 [Candidatus Hydrogenedentota bacterium]
MARKKTAKPRAKKKTIFVLKVALTYESEISRQIEIAGTDALEDLHFAIFEAFERDEEQLYSFFFGRTHKDHNKEYTPIDENPKVNHDTPGLKDSKTTGMNKLGLKKGRTFEYVFDFHDSWWHTLEVVAIEERTDREEYPRMVDGEGDSPPQYEEHKGDDDLYDEDVEDLEVEFGDFLNIDNEHHLD